MSQPLDPSLIFREVRIEDATFLVLLMEQLGYRISESEIKENIQHYKGREDQKAWVAEKAGKVVGCVAIAITNYFHRTGRFLRVITMVTDQEQRRSGIGKKLMHMAEQYAVDQGCGHVELTSGMHRAAFGSHDFYHSLGYEELNSTKKYFAKQV